MNRFFDPDLFARAYRDPMAWLTLLVDLLPVIAVVFFGWKAVPLVALYWSFETVLVSAKFGSVSHGLRVSMVWFLMAVPLGFSLMVWRLLQSLRRDMRSLRDGTPVFEGDKLFD